MTYSPPTTQNVGIPYKVPATTRKPEPAYKTLLPVHDATIASEVYKRSMEAPITITQRKLLSLSPEVHSQVRDSTMTCCIPNTETITSQKLVHVKEEENEIPPMYAKLRSPTCLPPYPTRWRANNPRSNRSILQVTRPQQNTRSQ